MVQTGGLPWDLALRLRTDYVGDDLRKAARLSKDASQTRRLLALAEIYDGGSRGHAARVGCVPVQIVRDWVERFNVQGSEGLFNVKAPGKRPKLSDNQRQELRRLVEKGPIPAIHGVVRWRLKDLARWIFQEHRISLDESTVGRELKAMGFAKLSARPRHYAQNELVRILKKLRAEIETIRKNLAPGIEIELWWQDEARIGQKNKITRRWAQRGTRPSAPHYQRTLSAYIFGAICPKKGKGAGIVMPWCDTLAMNEHLLEISGEVDPGAHAVLILDQAGWHSSAKLIVPENITLLFLPPRSPELNPVENVWQFMRDNWLSNRVFTSYDDIVDHCCEAWNKLIDQPWKIMSIGMRDWAHRS
ncbi:IS630 family transposase [Rhizobium leguminosarum]|uniref:IS630 family transposase n=1 Tax=Rhizobium leguminosarum TaxID=384 RepID=UPI003D7C1568